jgi:hypothetical protein
MIMSTPESQELQTRIDELIYGTRKGSFQWKAVNPTTYLWEKMDPVRGGMGARITLQRVQRSIVQKAIPGQPPSIVRESFFILQVFDMKPGIPQLPVLTVSGSSDPELNGKLQELFQLAASGFSQLGLEFLKSLTSQS